MNDLFPSNPSQADPAVVALMHGLKAAEGAGGNYNATGDQGTAAGIGQWSNQINGRPQKLSKGQIPANFSAQAQSFGLDPNDFSPENQNKVLYAEIAKGKAQGLTPEQILSKHNSGRPDAYLNTATSTGVGPVGAYDVADYVARGMRAAQSYASGSKQGSLLLNDNQGNNAPDPNSLLTSQGGSSNLDSQIQAILGQTNGQDTADQSLGGELQGRGQDAISALGLAGQGVGELTHGNIGQGLFDVGSGALQTGGAIAGGVGDVAGKVLGLIPGVKQVEGAIGQGIGAAAQTAPGQAIVGAAQGFSQAHPELSKDIGSAFNLAGLIGGGVAAKVGKDALVSGLKRDTFAATIDAISPDIKAGTTKGAADVSKNGVQKSGLFGRISRMEDPAMREAAPIVQDNVPNFDKLPTFTDKYNAIEDVAIPNEANALRTALTSAEVQKIITPEMYDEFKSSIGNAIENDANLIGDSGEYARRFLGNFESALPSSGPITAEDVLNARQALDAAAKSARPKVFDAARTNAYSEGLDAVRTAANRLIAQLAPDDVNVQASLRRQALLYRVLRNLAVKADKEVGTTRFSRFTGRHPKTTGLIKMAGKGALTGLGIEGASKLLGE